MLFFQFFPFSVPAHESIQQLTAGYFQKICIMQGESRVLLAQHGKLSECILENECELFLTGGHCELHTFTCLWFMLHWNEGTCVAVSICCTYYHLFFF